LLGKPRSYAMHFYRFCVTILVLSSLSFCSAPQHDFKPHSGQPQSPSEAINKRQEWLKGLASLETPKSQLSFDVIRYSPVLSYLVSEKPQLVGHVDILFRALEPLNHIQLNANVAQITAVQIATPNTKAEILDFEYSRSARSLKIKLPAPLSIGQESTVRIFYATLANDRAGTGLYHYSPKDFEDPNPHAMLYTKTEPQGTSGWMPSQDRPDDRAKLSLKITLPQELALVSNGLLTKDEFTTSRRVMMWETDIPIPTYLMAFAISRFQRTSQWFEGLELSIWSREGFPVDAHGLLNETRRQMKLFEGLMVPYPFEKYFIVLVPNFRGGMEHASVTFNDEVSSTVDDNNWDRYLMAHELGHHWFGDLVTIKTWDDLWIKEGMATLLAYEAMRETEGVTEKESSLGEMTWFTQGHAILDKSLSPGRKYTSGPYDRAAWWLTQLREAVGSDVFWQELRAILNDYRFSAIDSEEFLSYFKQHMSDAQFLRFEKALVARAIPQLEVQVDEEQDQVLLTLHDPEAALPLPLSIEIHQASSQSIAQLGALSQNNTLRYSRSQEDTLIVIDPIDLHPSIWAFVSEQNKTKEGASTLFENLILRQIPRNESLFKIWLADLRWGSRMGALNASGSLPQPFNYWSDALSADVLETLLNSSTSESQKTQWLNLACLKANFSDDAIQKQIRSQKLTGNFWFAAREQNNCTPWAKEALQASIDKAFYPSASSQLTDREVLILAMFKRGDTAQNKALWNAIQKDGATLRQRRLATSLQK
jgi:hypothetical protein